MAKYFAQETDSYYLLGRYDLDFFRVEGPTTIDENDSEVLGAEEVVVPDESEHGVPLEEEQSISGESEIEVPVEGVSGETEAGIIEEDLSLFDSFLRAIVKVFYRFFSADFWSGTVAQVIDEDEGAEGVNEAMEEQVEIFNFGYGYDEDPVVIEPEVIDPEKID